MLPICALDPIYQQLQLYVPSVSLAWQRCIGYGESGVCEGECDCCQRLLLRTARTAHECQFLSWLPVAMATAPSAGGALTPP